MADDVEFVGDVWGSADLPPALLLHGGGQIRHAWKSPAVVLAHHGYCAIAVDQCGHDDSGWSVDGRYEIDHFANDVRQLAASLPAKPVLIGASLGGMASSIAAGETDTSLATALVLVDITPRMEPAGVECVRKFMAARIDDGFATLEEAAEAIAAFLPHRPPPKNLDGLHRNLKRGKDGRYRWHYNPAFVRGMPARAHDDREVRLTAAAQGLPIPVLLVRGGSSELVSEDIARESSVGYQTPAMSTCTAPRIWWLGTSTTRSRNRWSVFSMDSRTHESRTYRRSDPRKPNRSPGAIIDRRCLQCLLRTLRFS